MNFLCLIVLARSIQSAGLEEWRKHTQPLDELFCEDVSLANTFEGFEFSNDDVPLLIVPTVHDRESALEILKPLPNDSSTPLVSEQILFPSQSHSDSKESSLSLLSSSPSSSFSSVESLEKGPPLTRPYSSNFPCVPLGKHAAWFLADNETYTCSQTLIQNPQPSMVFSQRFYQGVAKPQEYTFRMLAQNDVMGCRVTEDRILILDGYGGKYSGNHNSGKQLAHRDLSEATLEIETFRKRHPLISDGLAVALSVGNQLLMASYGKPPLGAILLRPKGEWLQCIARSSDNTVKTLDIQNRDIVIVGSLSRISQLELKTLRLKTSNEPKAIIEKIYGATSIKTLCIVATISMNSTLKSNNATTPSNSPQIGKRKKRKPPKPTAATHQDQSKSAGSTGAGKSAERKAWFFKSRNEPYTSSQANISSPQPPIVFSQRFYRGIVQPHEYPSHMSGRGGVMGYRAAQDRIILLDGYGAKYPAKCKDMIKWMRNKLSEATLESQEFRKMGYPLISDGLTVALGEGNQLLIASYGKPPLGAALLRPKGDWLQCIARSSDDAVKKIDIQNHDIVVVGPLDKISQLESKTLQLSAASTLAALTETIYGPANNKTLCFVVTISSSSISQLKRPKADPPSDARRKNSKNTTTTPFTASDAPSNSSQIGKRKKRKPQEHAVITHQNQSKSPDTTATLPERAVWFVKGRDEPYTSSQTNIRNTQPPIVFSQRLYWGVVKPVEYSFHMSGKSGSMGYRVTEDKIILLDGYGEKHVGNQGNAKQVIHCDLSKATLEIKELHRMRYPLISDGLIVAIDYSKNQLLMASYGKPPLGAILLRPKGDWLKCITRSSDDAVKEIYIQNHDIVIVGPLDKISALKSGTIQLKASSGPEAIAKTIYGTTKNRVLCIVATISINSTLKSNNATTLSNSPQVDDREKRKPPKPTATTLRDQSKSLGSAAATRLVKRTVWFFKGRNQYNASQDCIKNTQSPIVFSQRFYRGVVKPREYPFHMLNRNHAMGYRLTEDRILFLDGYRHMRSKAFKRDDNWMKHKLNEDTLEMKEFRKKYPLESDGLVVALGGKSRLLMASYGRPPLGAILLRPEKGVFTFIAFSPDNTVKAVNVQDGDIVVVGSLERISQLELGTLQLDASSTPKVVTKAIYDSMDDISICAVATISIIKPELHNITNALAEPARQMVGKSQSSRSQIKVRELLDLSDSSSASKSESEGESEGESESESEILLSSSSDDISSYESS